MEPKNEVVISDTDSEFDVKPKKATVAPAPVQGKSNQTCLYISEEVDPTKEF